MENTTEIRFLLPPKEVLQSMIEEAVQRGCENFIKQHFPPAKEADDYIDITEAAKILRRSKVTLYSMIKRGDLTKYKLKGSRGTLFKKNEIASCIEKVQFKYLIPR
jgi:excisionase family DNA binding protein